MGYAGLLVLLVMLGWEAAGRPAHAATVLVLGDSISAGYGIQREQGWVHLLAVRVSRIDRTVKVVNASVSGETSGGGLVRLPELLQRHRPKLVIVELGGNDALRGYPIPRLRANLEAIIDRSRGAGARVLLVPMEIPPNYGARYVSAFRAVFPEVARRKAVPLAGFPLQHVALERGLMQDDGIHPTAAAQPKLLAALWPAIHRELGLR